jgi:3-polyprenyl-4-hydroxybenzoate decarboxylase
MRLIVGMTGATGAPLGVSLLLALRKCRGRNPSGAVKVGQNHH